MKSRVSYDGDRQVINCPAHLPLVYMTMPDVECWEMWTRRRRALFTSLEHWTNPRAWCSGWIMHDSGSTHFTFWIRRL